MKNKVLITTILLWLVATTFGQSKQTENTNLIDPSLNLLENQYMNNQAEALLHQANEVLIDHLPAWPEPPARRSALLLMDGVLHDVYAPLRPPVQEYFKTRISRAIHEIEQSEITDGARIWKLYNHGFVIKTGTVCIGFDLVRGKSVRVEQFSIEDDEMSRLIDLCDVMFISHYHADHAEEWVAQTFIDKGKPVIAPPDVWSGKSIHKQITHMERVVHTEQILPIQGGQQELKVVVYPGHQGSDIVNNVYLVITPENLSFSHLGDQSNDDDFEWIDKVKNNHDVDVLLSNCWTTDIVRVAKGFSPGLIITGHENEMGHTIDHREPYWLSYQRQTGSDRFGGSKEEGYLHPLILMTWGESYHYNRTKFKDDSE
jgi:L-ascorbate metabolism protein UlaG (beta-lactamase superfamily)